jgi:hypothetical protein
MKKVFQPSPILQKGPFVLNSFAFERDTSPFVCFVVFERVHLPICLFVLCLKGTPPLCFGIFNFCNLLYPLLKVKYAYLYL